MVTWQIKYENTIERWEFRYKGEVTHIAVVDPTYPVGRLWEIDRTGRMGGILFESPRYLFHSGVEEFNIFKLCYHDLRNRGWNHWLERVYASYCESSTRLVVEE